MSKEIKLTFHLFGWFPCCLTLLFILLKLYGGLEWSWLWVASPLWLPITIVIALFVGYLLLMFILIIILRILDK